MSLYAGTCQYDRCLLFYCLLFIGTTSVLYVGEVLDRINLTAGFLTLQKTGKGRCLLTVVQEKMVSELKSIKFNTSKLVGIERVEQELLNALSDSEGTIREMCMHILNAGGKRVRPMLVMYSGLIFSRNIDNILNAAVAAELIHMASLVHDDIIDNSYLRRSKPSVNKMWGTHFAVLCGDYLFAKAFGILSGKRLTKSMDYMVEAIQNMCHGEILQAESRFNHDISLEEYYELISKKTAIFIKCCCESGACAGGAGKAHLRAISGYGLNLGLAFQIIDDILDFCGDVDVMGKPRGEDLKQGSITMPLIYLMRDSNHRARIKEILAEEKITDQHMEEIAGILEKSGVIKKSFDVARTHIEKAQRYLELLPESPYVDLLNEMAEMLKSRAN